MPSINVVVTCTKRKTRLAPSSLRLRAVKMRSIDERAREWIRRLADVESTTLTASSLYAGDQWKIARALPDITAAGSVRLWVCSAGYGLISANASIKPYSATFSSPHPDTVRTGDFRDSVEAVRDWWQSLADWEGPEPGTPRTLESLARLYPRSPLMVIASHMYLKAMEADVLRAASALRNSQHLCIISGGSDDAGALSDYLVPCDGRFQSLLGGALMSLNVRLARKVLQECDRWPLQRNRLRDRYKRLLDRQADMVSYDREPMSDRDVMEMIAAWLGEDPTLKHSPMLRRLRDSGFACEQKRFRSLYGKVRETRRGR